MDQNSTDNVCRICLKVQDTLFSLYRKRHGTSPFEKLISRTKLNIQLNDPGPASICSQCLIDLDTTVNFLDKCERSNQLLGARFTTSFDESEANLLEIEPESKLVPHEPRPQSQDANEVLIKDVKSSGVILHGEKCPECGSKRRCRHWAPPTVHTCQYCQKTFNKKYNYQLHIKRHLGETEFSCSTCGALQLTRWAAEQHCRPRQRQPCPVLGCGKSFTTSTNLHIHIRKHSGERPFECDDCGKSFISKNILNNHMRIHTGVKPYMCQVCGKQFATNKLSSHMERHAPAPRASRSRARARPAHATHACALCACTYKFKQSLNYHVKNTHGVGAKPAVRADTSPGMTSVPNLTANTAKECEL